MAKRAAKDHQGQSEESTKRLIQGKLAKEREVRVLEFALMLTSAVATAGPEAHSHCRLFVR